MSAKHPIVAVTGSSRAGTSTVRLAFEHMFRRLQIRALTIEGDSFHRYDRKQFREKVAASYTQGNLWPMTHFGAEGNMFDRLEGLFKQFGESGTGMYRRYIHAPDEAEEPGQEPGTFTKEKAIPAGTDLLFYEGLHGGVVGDGYNVAQHVDMLIGVVPIVNLEWIQKIHRDVQVRGYTVDQVTDTILRRMHDYVQYITPQFSLTDINFQRTPTVDTSNPFIARDIPTADESFVVIRFRHPKTVDFRYLLQMIHDSFMSRPNTIVVPGGKFGMALEVILQPRLEALMERKVKA